MESKCVVATSIQSSQDLGSGYFFLFIPVLFILERFPGGPQRGGSG